MWHGVQKWAVPSHQEWLRRGLVQVSTLDLVGRGRFTLLTGVGGMAWREAARSVAAATGFRSLT